MIDFNSKPILTTAVILVSFCSLIESYLISTHERWAYEEKNRVCVVLDAPAIQSDHIYITLLATHYGNFTESYILQKTKYSIPEGVRNHCIEVSSEVKKVGYQILYFGVLIIEGSLGNVAVNSSRLIYVQPAYPRTFLETDKYIYEPSQIVFLRFFTVRGQFLNVSKDEQEILIGGPSDSDFVSMANVSSTSGLHHWQYQIPENAEEGDYTIKINGKIATFNVEKHKRILQNVIIKNPKHIIERTAFNVEVCARTNKGDPMEGNLTVTLILSDSAEIIHKKSWISGCTEIEFQEREIKYLNGWGMKDFALMNATVFENGNSTALYQTRSVSVPIIQKRVKFEILDRDDFLKPELPFYGKLKLTNWDGTPFANEIMYICVNLESYCSFWNTTDSEGIIEFAIPPQLRRDIIRVGAENFGPNRYFEYVNKYSIRHYYSTSNSSLVIALNENGIECNSESETIDFLLPVHYAAANQDSAAVTVQVISRDHIQFSKTFDQELNNGSLEMDENIFIYYMPTPFNKGMVRGTFYLPISLPKTVSPKVEILIWYARNDGEVVADLKWVDISKCLLNDVSLSWSVNSSTENNSVTFSLAAEPNSLCSLGVVDKRAQNSFMARNISLDSLLHPFSLATTMASSTIPDPLDHEYVRHKCQRNERVNPTLPPTIESQYPGSRRKRDMGNWNMLDYDARRMFDLSGLSFISDLRLISLNCVRPHYGDLLDKPIIEHIPKVKPPPTGVSDFDFEDDRIVDNIFKDPWIWKFVSVNENGTVDETVTLPETPAEWMGTALCIHPTKGIGLSNVVTLKSTL